jgi:hypothetical protein
LSQYNIDQDDILNQVSADRLTQLTDDAGAGVPDVNKVNAAITASEGEFHLHAGVYYVTPVRDASGNIPEGVREFLVDSTVWRLNVRRPEFNRNDDDEGALWRAWRKDAMAWLNGVSAVKAELRKLIPGAVERTSTDTPRGGDVEVEGDCVRFGEGFYTR